MPDRLPLTSASKPHFTMGGMYSFAGTMPHSGFRGSERSHTKSRCLVYACMLEGTMINEKGLDKNRNKLTWANGSKGVS